MRYRTRALLAVAAVAATNLALVLLCWWALAPRVAPPPPRAAAAEVAPALAVQRLAETISAAAFRALAHRDQAGLAELVKQAAGWPEVAYLSVEDTQGRVIAHTDRARIGQPATADRPAAAPRPGLQEVTVALAGPEAAGTARALAGQVRLGYLAEEASRAEGPDSTAAPAAGFPLLAAVAAAALAAIPVGLGLVKLAGSGSGMSRVLAADLRKIGNLRQARITIAHWMKEAEVARADAGVQRAEVERLARELAERTAELSRAEAIREAVDREAAAWVGERERLRAEIRERTLDAQDAQATLRARSAEVEAAARARVFLEAELADLREEMQAARSALAVRPAGVRDAVQPELMQHQHRVIAYIARAIRGSLTGVLGFSKLLLRAGDGTLSRAQRASAVSIHEAGTRLLRVVNDLSDLTQVEAGAAELREEVVDVSALLREVASTAAAGLGRDPDQIAVEAPGPLPAVRGDRRGLGRLLLNVMHPLGPDGGGPTEVAARADEQGLRLAVTHRGVVIPCEEMAVLFDPFSPIDATQMLQDDGRRLRLGLARALAGAMGGQLTVETLDGTDTVFTLALPVTASVAAVA